MGITDQLPPVAFFAIHPVCDKEAPNPRGRGRKKPETKEEQYRRIIAYSKRKVKKPWRKPLSSKLMDSWIETVYGIDLLTGYSKINPYRAEDALTMWEALKIVLMEAITYFGDDEEDEEKI